MPRFLTVIRNKNIQILLVYRGLRSVIYAGPTLFQYYVLFVLLVSPKILGVIIFVGYFTSMFGSLLGGYFTDKVGRKLTLIVSSFLAGCGWIALSLSQNWIQTALSFGLTNGLMVCAYPAYTALVSDSIPEDVGSGLGILNTITGIIWAIGALLAATTAEYLGFRYLFMIIAIPYFVSLAPTLRIEERKSKETNKPFKFARFNHFNILKESPNLFFLSLSVLLVTFGLYSVNFYADYVEKEFNISKLQVGIFDSIYQFTWALTNYPLGSLSDRIGRKKVIIFGYTLEGIAWLLFFNHSLFWLFILYAVYALGSSMGYFATALAMDITSKQKKGTAVGVFNSFMYIGILLSGIVGGILWEYFGALTSFRITFITAIVATLIIYFFVKGTEQNSS
ncbi:MAG: MFS transporter [Candidatus Heimdallarchaeota archaeon]